jgi:4-amino-4-deoxy-L-arabinose transferase-like glycosyltransferase
LKFKFFALLYAFALLPAFFALPLDLIDIDTAQYAEITREMVETGNYLHLKDNGKKYLDKPILTFWTIAGFFKFFGIGEIQFRLPALLALLITSLSVAYTAFLIWRNERKAFLAGLFYICIPGSFAIVLNPLIDIYLCMYLALIHLTYYLGVKQNKNWFLLMYWFAGMGFITKGPISVVIPIISIAGDLFFRRDWKRLSDMKLYLGIPIVAILPTIWSLLLYQEYSDYGPYFFLWQQSFGRFYDKIYNQRFDPFYFYSNLLWGVFPFAGYLLYAVYRSIRDFLKTNKPFLLSIKNKWNEEWRKKDFVIGFWVFLFIFFISFSRFQLPQYTYWVLPGASIFLAGFVESFPRNSLGSMKNLLFHFPAALSIAFILVVPFLVIDTNLNYWITVLLCFGFGVFIYIKTKEDILINIIPMVTAMILVSLFIFPELLKYQPSKEMGQTIRKLEPNKTFFYAFGLSHSKRSYEFYSTRLMRNFFDKSQLENELQSGDFRLIITPLEYSHFLMEKVKGDYKFEILEDRPAHKIATLSQKFLKKTSRESSAKRILLVKLTKL